jgi:OOP family OmpA-OmpF porin
MSKAILSATIALAAGSLFITGCATKNYVKQTTQPLEKKIGEVDSASQQRDSQQVSDINKTNQQVDENDKKIGATNELAQGADNTAKSAMAKANQDSRDISDLRGVIANIDDYKPSGQPVTVHFKVNQYMLSKDDKASLDQVASQVGSMQRYFITVMGYTDQTGPKTLNDRLSRERAEAVISYLVGSHDIPVYRIHVVGLGDQKLIDNGKGRKAREESRRAEITVYAAPPVTGGGSSGN